MTISEMHVAFRSLGQQMGIQLVRGILPEQIDILLNQAINEKCRSILISNVTTQFKDKVSIRDNSLGIVNALRTLYTISDIAITPAMLVSDYYKIVFPVSSVFVYTSFGLDYANQKNIKTRLIDGEKLEVVLNDFCNTASWDNPIISLFKDHCRLFINNTTKVPTTLHIKYIALPVNVNFTNNVNCDLPEYLHNEIVELAVDKYSKSIHNNNT